MEGLIYMKSRLIIILLCIAILGIGCKAQKQESIALDDIEQNENNELESEQAEPQPNRVDFYEHNSVYRFSAQLPQGFAVEYVPEIESINIYNPKAEAETAQEQSQIFIRYFEADRFLTLSTVDILNQEKTESNNREAVKYEIKKKAGVADFAYQPLWRNELHKLIDIRYRKSNPSFFYVFSYNPLFPEQEFEKFIQSLIFYNDLASFSEPIKRSSERVTKKPFGIYITPENSPVAPERFEGFHTGIDYETFDTEQGIDVAVYAICTGEIIAKQSATGYGGIIVQSCDYEEQNITVLYGHIALSSVTHMVGDAISSGTQIALLGEVGDDTDNERKHLHLGIKKGSTIDLTGYVQTKQELDAWMDF